MFYRLTSTQADQLAYLRANHQSRRNFWRSVRNSLGLASSKSTGTIRVAYADTNNPLWLILRSKRTNLPIGGTPEGESTSAMLALGLAPAPAAPAPAPKAKPKAPAAKPKAPAAAKKPVAVKKAPAVKKLAEKASKAAPVSKAKPAATKTVKVPAKAVKAPVKKAGTAKASKPSGKASKPAATRPASRVAKKATSR